MAWIPALGPVESTMSGVAHSYKTVANATGRKAYLSHQPWALSNFQISWEKSHPLRSLSFCLSQKYLNALCRFSFAVTLRLLVFLPHENSSVWRVYANGEAAFSYGRTTATDFAAVLPE